MSTFRPIDFQPLDVLPGVNLLMAAKRAKSSEDLAKQNADTQRQFAENTNRRISAQEARDAEKHRLELEDRARNQELERSQQLLPTSPLMEAARKYGAGIGNAVGKPYGISFDEQVTPPSLQGLDLFKAAGNSFGEHAKKVLAGQPSTPEVDAISGGQSPMPSEQPEEAGEPAGQQDPIEEAQERLTQPPQRKTFASVGGQRFEVPAEEPFTTGLGPQYDAIAQHLAEAGGGDRKAKQAALAEVSRMFRGDDNQAAIAARAAEAAGRKFQDEARYKRTVEQQGEADKFKAAAAKERSLIAANAKVASAGVEKPSAADNAEATAQKTFLQDFKDYRDKTAQAQAEIKSARQIKEILTLAQSKDPTSQALAIEQLAKVAHGGNVVTRATQDLIYRHLGGLLDRWQASARQLTNGGTLPPSQLRNLMSATAALDKHARENRDLIKRGAETQFGPASSYGNEYMQPYVRQHLDALYQEMGDNEPSGVSAPTTEGSVRLGRNREKKVNGGASTPKRTPTLPSAAQGETDEEFLSRILK